MVLVVGRGRLARRVDCVVQTMRCGWGEGVLLAVLFLRGWADIRFGVLCVISAHLGKVAENY